MHKNRGHAPSNYTTCTKTAWHIYNMHKKEHTFTAFRQLHPDASYYIMASSDKEGARIIPGVVMI